MFHKVWTYVFIFSVICFQNSFSQDEEAPAEEAAAPAEGEAAPEGGGDGADGGGENAEDGGASGNNTGGDELWEKWNATGMGEEDQSWLVKYCPRGIMKGFEMICVLHCWKNGWQGGKCTKQDICICNWDGMIEDFGADLEVDSVPEPGVDSAEEEKSPAEAPADGTPGAEEAVPAEPTDE